MYRMNKFRYIKPFSRNYDFKKKWKKNNNLKYLWNLWINPFSQRILSIGLAIGIQNLPLQTISERLSQFYSSYATTQKKITFFINYFFLQK